MPEEGELEAATEPEEEEPKEILDDDNIVMHCALRSDIDRLKQVFDSNDDPNHEAALEKLNERNKLGKTPAQMACMLGNEAILQEIVKRGVDVNEQTATGYTLLHTAACWGHRLCLEVLFENGANLSLRNNHGETAKQVAVRYRKEECIEYLDWAEADETIEKEKKVTAKKKK